LKGGSVPGLVYRRIKGIVRFLLQVSVLVRDTRFRTWMAGKMKD